MGEECCERAPLGADRITLLTIDETAGAASSADAAGPGRADLIRHTVLLILRRSDALAAEQRHQVHPRLRPADRLKKPRREDLGMARARGMFGSLLQSIEAGWSR